MELARVATNGLHPLTFIIRSLPTFIHSPSPRFVANRPSSSAHLHSFTIISRSLSSYVVIRSFFTVLGCHSPIVVVSCCHSYTSLHFCVIRLFCHSRITPVNEANRIQTRFGPDLNTVSYTQLASTGGCARI